MSVKRKVTVPDGRSCRATGGSLRPSRRRLRLASGAPENRPAQLALDPHRREPDSRQPPGPLVDEEARLPARRELRVEAVEALDLEVRAALGASLPRLRAGP